MKHLQVACRCLIAPVLLAGFGAVSASAQSFAATGTTTLSVSVVAEASISIDSATSLTSTPGLFADYTGTTGFTYKVRTTESGGTGTINVRITADFAAGGPSVASPVNGNSLTYTCTVSAPGTACSGSLTVLTSATTSVATFAADARSAKAGNSGSLAWTLTNDPDYKTGSYSATATFTISAT